jgi:acyl-CoA reductase-like NAD-dependent aldehyde dehydrogenase
MTYGTRQLLIDGKLVDAESDKTFQSINPATGEVLARVAEGEAPDIDKAVAAARRAFEQHWRDMPAPQRGALLRKVADLIRERADDLAMMETLDNGKPLHDSKAGDIPGAAAYFDFYAGAPDKIHGDTVPFPGFLNYTVREPVGVVGAIVPWNYPLALAAIKCAPALACGNTVVLKPAEQTPLTALELGKICLDAGMPPGVLNVVTGFGPTAGAALARHTDVDKVTFTGSSEVGHRILEMSATNLKRTVLELGGKTPNIVFADADLDAALSSAVRTIFLNQGQICTAGSRLLIEESIKDEFVERLVAKAQRLKVGDPLKPDTKLGAIVSQEQLDKIKMYIDLGAEAASPMPPSWPAATSCCRRSSTM